MNTEVAIDADLSAIRDLGPVDRELVAAALADSIHLVDDDMGENPAQRHAAYRALAKLVRQMAA